MRNLQDSFILLALSLLTASLIGADASAQLPKVPYDALVLNANTKVYSGPGGAFYPTHELAEGELVKVYRHDPGGWCAIRPPEKSFSLVPESAIEMLTEDIGEVLADETQTWVGTLLGPVEKPLPQVKINKGDRVVVVGEIGWPHPSGTTNVWYQIEPPAGEFRWIRLSDLQLPPVDEPVTKAPASKPERMNDARADRIASNRTKPARREANRNSSKQIPNRATSVPTFADTLLNDPSVEKQNAAQVSFEQPLESTSEKVGSGWRAATKPIPKSDSEYSSIDLDRRQDLFSTNDAFDRGFSNDSPGFSNSRFNDQAISSQRSSNWNNGKFDPLPPRSDRFASLESMDSQIRSFNTESYSSPNANPLLDLENRLSKEMVKDPEQWKLDGLKQDAQDAYQRSTDAVERMALQRVLDKLRECDTLQQGFLASSSVTTPSFGRSSTSTPSAVYDAKGWLKRLASSAGSVDPIYVLQDDNGKTTHHVAGSIGMNLSRYVDSKIGIVGRRGFHRRLNLDHVTVDRIVVLPR